MISHTGAQTLLSYALPMEIHVDLFLYILASQGKVRGYMVRQSEAKQCDSWHEGGMDHFNGFLVNWKVSDVHLPWGWLLCLVLIFLFVCFFQGQAGERSKRTLHQ